MNVITVVLLIVVAVSADDIMKQCGPIFTPNVKDCCVGISPADYNKDLLAKAKECFDLPIIPDSCERDECFAKKQGYYSSDGGIKKEVFIPITEKLFENDPEMLSQIMEKCVKSDISKYGPVDMCYLSKLRHCLQLQILTTCPDFNDVGKCAGIEGLVKECAKKFP